MFSGLYDYIIDYLNSAPVQEFLFWAKLTSIGICVLLLTTIIILLSRSQATWWVAERLDSFRKVKLPERLEKNWQKIQERLEKTDEANLKLAIIEADYLLDEILKRMGLAGKDMGERLEQLGVGQLKTIDEVWEAHRLRNLIVHQPNVMVTNHQVEKAIASYEKALKELEVL